jgi:hypothetical protein
MAKFAHELGKKGQDKITGFQGIIIGRCEHLYGCNTYGLSTQVSKEGNRIQTEWFDEARIIIIGKGIFIPNPDDGRLRANRGGEYTEHP